MTNHNLQEELNKNNWGVPEQTKEFNFTLLGGNGKQPIEKAWQKKTHRINCPILQAHIQSGKNYGVQSNGSTDGKGNFLIVIDFDNKTFQDKIISRFPPTFSTSSGSKKNCLHLWFFSNNNKAFKIKDEQYNTLCDVIGGGNQIVGVGSKHLKSGGVYHVVSDLPIAFIEYSTLEAILKPCDLSPKKQKKLTKPFTPKSISNDISDRIYNGVSMDQILSEIGVDTNKNPTNCFLHSSNGGKCFSYDGEKAHCFHCEGSWNKFSLIREAKKISNRETFEWFADASGLRKEYDEAKKEYIATKRKEIEGNIFTRRGQVEKFWVQQPFFYDASKIFWLWDQKTYTWVMSDEVEFCNRIYDTLKIDTISSKARAETIEGFKQIGRKHKPLPFEKTWIQFKDKIYNIKTGENFEASPDYFGHNPLPWRVGKSEDTPTINRLFSEWVEADYVKSLFEVIAYSMSSNQFMQRIISLCGGGSNGKGTWLKLLLKFLGESNCVSSEIRSLSEDRFEPAVLYSKILCIMGEVSHDDLRNTNILKKISGEDKLSFQFKGKTPFTSDNTATCICATNSMPITPDKSVGFYRRWFIIDFPNQFKDIKGDIIAEIPDVEFENLGRKSLRILKELYNNPKFSNEGDFEHREKRYEERSNPIMRFIEEKCKEEAGILTPLRHFSNLCNQYLKENHLRVMSIHQLGKVLRDEGFQVSSRGGVKSVINLLPVTKTTNNTHFQSRNLRKETSSDLGGFGGFSSSQRGNN